MNNPVPDKNFNLFEAIISTSIPSVLYVRNFFVFKFYQANCKQILSKFPNRNHAKLIVSSAEAKNCGLIEGYVY